MDIKLVHNKESYVKALLHRLNVYKFSGMEHLTNQSSQFQVELSQDEISYIFCGHIEDQIVASCRVTDVRYVDPALKKLIDNLLPLEIINKSFLISRLCISVEQQGKECYYHLVKYVNDWAYNHDENHSYYISKCRTNYFKLYEKYGCEIVPGSNHIDEYSGFEYILLLGNIKKTYNLMRGIKK